jgi:Concanavalin A-like lectin/glucanases superfamily/Right handed beta helix region
MCISSQILAMRQSTAWVTRRLRTNLTRGYHHDAPLAAILVSIIGLIAAALLLANSEVRDSLLRQAAPPTSTSYYLSPTGDDRSNGLSPATAWQTIRKVNATYFGPGDRILLQGGQAFESSVPLRLHVNGPGEPAYPIIIDSFGEGKATLKVGRGDGIEVYWIGGVEIRNINVVGDGPQLNIGNGIVFQTAADAPFRGRFSHVYIDDVDVSGFGGDGIVFWGEFSNGYNDVRITDSRVHDIARTGIKFDGYSDAPHGIYPHSNLYIARNIVHDITGIKGANSGSGVSVARADTAMVELNTVFNNGWLGGDTHGGPVGIWSYESTRVIIQRNESYGNHSTTVDGGGFDLDGGSTQGLVQYNYSHDNDGPGFLMAQFPTADRYGNNIIRYNISENDGRKRGSGSIELWNGGSGVRDVDVHNNTVFSSSDGDSAAPAVKFISGSKNIRIRNNVFITSGSGPLVWVAAGQDGLVFRGNAYWASGAPFRVEWSGTEYASLAEWRRATSQEMNWPFETGWWEDPEYEHAGSGGTVGDARALWALPGYHLKPTSPLIGHALDAPWPGATSGNRDFYGHLVSTQSFDIGAVQYGRGDTSIPPTTLIPVATVSPLDPVTPRNGPAGTGLQAGLVAYYRMDEPSWSGGAGEVGDSSGWGNTATARNGAKTGPGRLGRGGLFDGKSSVVSVDDSPSLEIAGPMTVAAWVKLDSLPDRLADLVIKSHHLAPWQSYELLYDNTTRHFGFSIANSSGDYRGSKGPNTVSPDVWYHVVGVYDGSSIITYVNGVAGAPIAYSGEPYLALGPLYIGDEGDGATDLPGILDEIRIYNRALTEREVAELYRFTEASQ